MDIPELELFLVLAETRHFGLTAERLHLSPSAVSRTLQRMEERVGQRLVERDNRQVRLTVAGDRFRDYARGAVVQWRTFLQSVQPDHGLLRGQISLYCSVTAAHSLLAELLPVFRQRHPGIDLKLHTGDQADAIDRVLSGEDDLAIAAVPERTPRRLLTRILAQSPLVFIAPLQGGPVDLLLERRNPSWDEIPLILSERGLARQRIDAWCREQGIKPNVYAQVTGHEAIVSMVSLGFGVGVVPELVLAASPLKDAIRRIDNGPRLAPFSVGLCVTQQRLDNPLVRAFWENARAS